MSNTKQLFFFFLNQPKQENKEEKSFTKEKRVKRKKEME